MLKDYIAYFKDNPKGYWFKARIFGWGWIPVKWQGWLTIFAFAILVALDSARLGMYSNPSNANLEDFIFQIAVLVVLLIIICLAKGEKPRWQWGIPKKK